MKLKTALAVLIFPLVVQPLVCQSRAWAQLGGDESSVELDRGTMRGVRKMMMSKETYHVQEIDSPGNVVREYVNQDGTVFGVTWCGISHPNLSQIFGNYYQEFHEADLAMKKPRGRAPRHLNTRNLATVRYGHMRNVCGKAFIQNFVPRGFHPRDLE